MYLGKTLLLGDSYSTFEGAVPEGYDSWYSKTPGEPTDVRKKEQTWWYRLFDGKNNILVRNESYSGTTISNSVRPEHSIDVSFINRFDRLVNIGFFNENRIDTVLIFGGTNDSWIDSPIGKNQFEDFSKEDLMKTLPACGYLARRVSEVLPGAFVCWLINTGLKEEIADGMIKNAEHFSHDYIRFANIDKLSGHPSVKGMDDILTAVKRHFNQ